MTCKDCIHSGLCYKENDYENFPDRCGSFISDKVLEERSQGEWEYDKLFGDCAYVCSFCHTIWMSSEIQNMHYCPTCGADMRGKEE